MFKNTSGIDLPPKQIARDKKGRELTYIQTNQVQTMTYFVLCSDNDILCFITSGTTFSTIYSKEFYLQNIVGNETELKYLLCRLSPYRYKTVLYLLLLTTGCLKFRSKELITCIF
jgi:hypothetical protein